MRDGLKMVRKGHPPRHWNVDEIGLRQPLVAMHPLDAVDWKDANIRP